MDGEQQRGWIAVDGGGSGAGSARLAISANTGSAEDRHGDGGGQDGDYRTGGASHLVHLRDQADLLRCGPRAGRHPRQRHAPGWVRLDGDEPR